MLALLRSYQYKLNIFDVGIGECRSFVAACRPCQTMPSILPWILLGDNTEHLSKHSILTANTYYQTACTLYMYFKTKWINEVQTLGASVIECSACIYQGGGWFPECWQDSHHLLKNLHMHASTLIIKNVHAVHSSPHSIFTCTHIQQL